MPHNQTLMKPRTADGIDPFRRWSADDSSAPLPALPTSPSGRPHPARHWRLAGAQCLSRRRLPSAVDTPDTPRTPPSYQSSRRRGLSGHTGRAPSISTRPPPEHLPTRAIPSKPSHSHRCSIESSSPHSPRRAAAIRRGGCGPRTPRAAIWLSSSTACIIQSTPWYLPTGNRSSSRTGRELFVIDAGGGARQTLAIGMNKALSPSWSSDGKWVLFSGAASYNDPCRCT